MNWRQLSDEQPTEGLHLVYAASADPDRPLIVTAWWHAAEKQWSIINEYWAKAVTHWMPLPPAPQ